MASLRALTIALFSLLATSAASASEWSVPAGCPDRAYAEARMRALRVDPSVLSRGLASVRVDRAPTAEFRAVVALQHGEGREERVLYDGSCQAVVEAALLVLSVSFEGESAARTERVAPARVAPPEATPAKQVRASKRHALGIAPLVGLDAGSLPKPTYVVGGTMRLAAPRAYAELDGTWFGPVRARRGEFGLASAALRGCYAWQGAAHFSLAPCVALEVGQARGRGVGVSNAQRRSGPWAAGVISLAATFPVQRLSPSLELGVALPFRRPAFDIADEVAFQARSWAVRAALRLSLELLSWRTGAN